MGQDYYNLLSERNRTYQFQAKGILSGHGLSKMKAKDESFAKSMGYSPDGSDPGSGGGGGGNVGKDPNAPDPGKEIDGISSGGSKATNITDQSAKD